MPKTFQPPKAAQQAAQKVLDWKEKYGDEVKGMTEVGWARARQLASGKPISLDTVKRMAQFNRHRQNSKIDPKYKGTPWKDAGFVAFEGWGSSEGIDWAIRVSERESKMQKAYLSAIDLLSVAKAYIQQPRPMVYKANHTGVIVALFPPPYLAEKLALPDGEEPDELHITLAYLGDMDDVDNLTGLLPAVWNWAKQQQVFTAKINGVGRFNTDEDDEKTAFIALVDCPIFPPFRESLMLTLLANGYSPVQEHGFIPHITLKYIETDEPLPMQNIETMYIPFGAVSLVIGEQRFDLKLRGEQPTERAMVSKYGARNSRPDLGMLQQVHDLTVKLGATCDSGKVEKGSGRSGNWGHDGRPGRLGGSAGGGGHARIGVGKEDTTSQAKQQAIRFAAKRMGQSKFLEAEARKRAREKGIKGNSPQARQRSAANQAEKETREQYEIRKRDDGGFDLVDKKRATSAYRGVSVNKKKLTKAEADEMLDRKVKSARTRAINKQKDSEPKKEDYTLLVS